ncbi:APC family permease [Pantoea cypripedii]|uniref:Amino acid permease n=1 Tax=Pantoea cypripedii TaxID=55209 RepID=A0A6B9GFU8_PANCY|nr:amino acid permease [Pantoea cypripedii]QGY32325.1 amino acid permease [Pantoea cypripedii]
MTNQLKRSIKLPQAIALYVGAVIGAGVLVLPGSAADIAGPASIISWCIVSLLGIPLALTFASLAGKFPDAGGVATYAGNAFNEDIAAVVGWFYFFAAATGEIIIPLTGAYYAANYPGISRGGTYLIAAFILMITVSANIRGLRASGSIALFLSSAVVLMLVFASGAAVPDITRHWSPFMPDGWMSIGQASVFIFYAFFGWEVISHLAEEFVDPERDMRRATLWSVGVVTILYVAIAAAVIGTGTYGTPELNRTAVARLLSGAMGIGAGQVAAIIALVVALGTSNAYIAGASRLGYALARDGAFPRFLGKLDKNGVPVNAVLCVGIFAFIGLGVSWLFDWGVEDLLSVPNALGIATYVIGLGAGYRLLTGKRRFMSLVGGTCCVVLMMFAGLSLLWPLGMALIAVLYRRFNLQKCVR